MFSRLATCSASHESAGGKVVVHVCLRFLLAQVQSGQPRVFILLSRISHSREWIGPLVPLRVLGRRRNPHAEPWSSTYSWIFIPATQVLLHPTRIVVLLRALRPVLNPQLLRLLDVVFVRNPVELGGYALSNILWWLQTSRLTPLNTLAALTLLRTFSLGRRYAGVVPFVLLFMRLNNILKHFILFSLPQLVILDGLNVVGCWRRPTLLSPFFYLVFFKVLPCNSALALPTLAKALAFGLFFFRSALHLNVHLDALRLVHRHLFRVSSLLLWVLVSIGLVWLVIFLLSLGVGGSCRNCRVLADWVLVLLYEGWYLWLQ